MHCLFSRETDLVKMTRFGAGQIALMGFTTVIAPSISISMSVLANALPRRVAAKGVLVLLISLFRVEPQ
jgi:hypothetical protein